MTPRFSTCAWPVSILALALLGTLACDKKKETVPDPAASGAQPLNAAPGASGKRWRAPSPEALAACAGKAADAACTYKRKDRDVTGTCKARRDAGADAPLSCRSDRKGRRGGGADTPADPD